MSPEIDVVVPVYNAAPTVAASIRSLLDQTLKNIGIIVVDDGSTDGSREIIEGLADEDTRVQLVTKTNSGIVDALNLGMAAGSAPLIGRLDGDDLSDPIRLERQKSYLDEHPDCVAVSSNARYMNHDGSPARGRTHFGDFSRVDPFFAPASEPYISHPFLIMRRSAVEKIGGYRHCLHAEDADLYWRLSSVGRLHGLPETHGQYRLHPNSITQSSIVNARIGAVSSQLAALAEIRRLNGRPSDDLFPRDLFPAYKAAKSMGEVYRLAADRLDETERGRLEVASAMKLAWWVAIRKYDLEEDDCAFIMNALDRHAGTLSRENRRHVNRIRARVVLKMLRRGKVKPARMIYSSALIPAMAGQTGQWLGRKVLRS